MLAQLASTLAQTDVDYEFNYDDYYTTSNDLSGGEAAGIFAVLGAIWLAALAAAVVSIIAMWKIFTKAGKPGWASIIPIYNTLVMLEIVGRPVWWIVLMFIPFVNIVVWLILSLDLAKAFGKSPAFGVVGLFLFSLVGMLMLAFGSAKYVGAPHSEGQKVTPETPGPAQPAA